MSYVGFRASAVLPCACGKRPASNRTLEVSVRSACRRVGRSYWHFHGRRSDARSSVWSNVPRAVRAALGTRVADRDRSALRVGLFCPLVLPAWAHRQTLSISERLFVESDRSDSMRCGREDSESCGGDPTGLVVATALVASCREIRITAPPPNTGGKNNVQSEWIRAHR